MNISDLCELIYPVPDPWATLEHRDVSQMSGAEPHRERARLDLRLTLDDAPPAWLLERRIRLQRIAQGG